MNRPIVLGGGVAGIAAAVMLAQEGARPLLIESRPALGGRVRSFYHTQTGDEIDNGQHLLMGCYHRTLHLLSVLGSRHLLSLQPSLSVEFRNQDASRMSLSAPSGIPSPLNVLLAMLRFSPLTFSERIGLTRVGLNAKYRTPLPNETVEAYLIRLGQSETTRRLLWDPIVLATLNTSPSEASARLFVQVMRLGFLGSGDDSKLAIPRAGLSQLFGNPATQYIAQAGGAVRTGSPVISVQKDGEEFCVLMRNGSEYRTHLLLTALHWRGFQGICAPLLPDLEAVNVGIAHNPIISVYLWFDQGLETIPEFAAMNGSTVEWVFNRRTIIAERNAEYPGLLCCVISAAQTAAKLEHRALIRIVEQELRNAFPEIGSAQLLTAQVINEKHATFAATPATETLRPKANGHLPGLFIAGDWTATDLPGTIEGAVQSGEAAATALLHM